MNQTERVRVSKRLSLVLRHAPDRIGITLPSRFLARASGEPGE